MVDAEIGAVKAAIDQEKAEKSGVSVMDMFTNPVDRRRTILTVAAINTQAASGAMFMIGMVNQIFFHSKRTDAFVPQHTEPTSSKWPEWVRRS